MHNTCMKKHSNLKCKVIIGISYTQTHQPCLYNFTFKNLIPMFVDEVMLIWFLLSLFESLAIVFLILKIVTSKILITSMVIVGHSW